MISDGEARRMLAIEEYKRSIEKYQEKHPLPFGTMMDVTAICDKEGADIISQTIERISKQMEKDTDLWCICEMAKMYMQGVRPVYPVRPTGKWEEIESSSDLGHRFYHCSVCNRFLDVMTADGETLEDYPFCHCGADMRGDDHED